MTERKEGGEMTKSNVCPEGHVAPFKGRFCNTCGTRLIKYTWPHCPHCKKKLASKVEYCNHCGKEIDW